MTYGEELILEMGVPQARTLEEANELLRQVFSQLDLMVEDYNALKREVREDRDINRLTLVIPSPGATENATLHYTDRAITLTSIRAVVVGSASPSVTWNIRFAADRDEGSPSEVFGSNQTTTSEAGEELTFDTKSGDDPTIPAGMWVWFITTAESGTTLEIAISAPFTEDAA